MDGITLVTLLEDLLDAAVASIGVTAPARQFVAHGSNALDCEHVSVEIVDASVSPIDPAMCAGIDTITFAVEVVRCYIAATGDNPIPAASGIGADSYTIAFDLGALMGGLGDRWEAGTLFPSLPALDCGQVQIIGAQPVGPECGYAGWRLTVTVQP